MQSHQPFQGDVQLILLFSNTAHFSLNFTNSAYIVVQTATPIGPKTKKAAPGAAFLGLGSRVGETNAIEILRVHFWVSPLSDLLHHNNRFTAVLCMQMVKPLGQVIESDFLPMA